MVSGSLRATDSLLTITAQFKILNAPDASNSTTYGPGEAGGILRSNGTSIYWNKLLETAYGGTGNTSYTQWGIVYANPATKLVNTAAGTNGALLQGKGSAAPAWKASANGAVYATAANGDLQWGTLPVGQGGTDRTTLTTNAVLYGNGTSAIGMLASANGAVYATAANGALNFGTLPTGQGGTGNTAFTATRMIYSESATKLSSADHIYVLNDYLISNSRNNQTVDVRANGLIIYGPTYGNTVSGDADGACRDLLSNKAGVFRFSDGGPQIIFNTSASFGAQAGALIYTDNDSAATGASFHFVTTESSNDNGGNLTVTAPRFRARKGLAIGQNSDNTTYKLYVNGTSYFNGNTTHNGIDYFANGTTYYINNSANANLNNIYANSITGYDGAGFISSTAGNPWPYIRFDTRAGGTDYITTAQTTWAQIYAQLPAKRASDNAYYNTRFFFRQYSKTANTTTRVGYYEDYYLPNTTDGRTTSVGYDIRTSKSSAYNVDTATRINGNLPAATSDVNRNIWVSSTASADGIPNYISGFNMNPSTKVFTVPSGTRISPSAGALYLGNSGNQSWVYVQDMASQASGTPWKLTQAGVLTCVTVNANLTGNVTGNCSGSSASCTGNAAGLSGGLVTNTVTSHGNLAVTTAKGSYYGINLGHNTSGMTIMSINASHQGLYNQANGEWPFYYNAASNSKSIVIGNSTVNVTGGISLNKNTKVTGTLTISSYCYFANGTTYYINSSGTGNLNALTVNAATASSSTSTGALIVKGGIGAAGKIYGSQVYNAVWNDYAECRHSSELEPGRCVTETSTIYGMMRATERLLPGCKLVSDTYGTLMGETDNARTPIAVSGRVLVYPYRNKKEYSLGAAVCSAPNGTVDIMTREEIMMYPERIVGTVSEIPTYEIWHGGNQDGLNDIQVNGRIWIYVK